jgi:hypothetical protein
MLRFFEAFLAASGYILKGDLQVVETPTYNPEFRLRSISSVG